MMRGMGMLRLLGSVLSGMLRGHVRRISRLLVVSIGSRVVSITRGSHTSHIDGRRQMGLGLLLGRMLGVRRSV